MSGVKAGQAILWSEGAFAATREQISGLLSWAHGKGATDVTFMTGHPVYVEVEKKIRPVTVNSLFERDMEIIRDVVYGNGAAAAPYIEKAVPKNFSVNRPGSKKFGFVVHSCVIVDPSREGKEGFQMNFYCIDDVAPKAKGTGR